jgi:hypothetical protein
MTMGHRALAALGITLSCAGLLLGLVGAEHLLTFISIRRATPAMMSPAQVMGALTLALLLVAAGVACLYRATLHVSRHPSATAPGSTESERHPPGSVTL